MNFRHLTLIFSLLIGLVGSSYSIANAQDGVISDLNYFEGAIHYSFSVNGSIGADLQELNNINLMTWFIKDGDYIVQLYATPKAPEPFDPENPRITINQTFPTTRLYIADSDRTFIIDTRNERYFLTDGYTGYNDTTIPVAVSNKDSVKILGMWCYGYKYNYKGETVWVYINPKYRVNTSYFQGKKQAKANFLVKGLNGCIPLKIVRKNADRTIENHATKIIPSKFSVDQFRIPPNYKRFSRDYRR
jgi:hypothetical protein